MSARKIASDAGFKPSSDPFVLKKDNSTITMRPGKGIIIDHGGRHNNYGIDTSGSALAKRLK